MSFRFRDLLVVLGVRKHPEESGESDDENVDTKVNIHTLYKHRWVWYHLILCVQMILTNILLIGILITLAIKL
tara:strand:+ start:699 stop:917 length:219 start_codon:yes stop_codon:yes gene_type:complete